MGFHGKQWKFLGQAGEYLDFAGGENHHLVVKGLSLGDNGAITAA
jgi:hypothetical protein